MSRIRKYEKLGKKRLIWTTHVQKRMSKREVTKKQIYETLKNHEVSLPKQPDNTQEFRRRVGSKVHYVVVEHCPKVIRVITTGWGGEE